MQIKTTMKYHSTSFLMAKMKNNDDTKFWQWYREIGSLIHCWWVNGTVILEDSLAVPHKVKYSLSGGGVKMAEKQDGETTFSPTNSSKEQLNGEQSLQNNFWLLAADIRCPEKQPIVFEGRQDKMLKIKKGDKRAREGDPSREGSLNKGSFQSPGNPRTGGSGGTFQISEGNLTGRKN